MQFDTFGKRVQKYVRDSGHFQKELAEKLDLHPKVLSRKLHGNDAYLNYREVREIILALADWHAIYTQDEVYQLLKAADLDLALLSDDEWRTPPLSTLRPVRQFTSDDEWRTPPLRELAPKNALKIFFSYSHRDRQFLDQLKAQLSPLVRQGLITLWSDGELTPGSLWETEIINQLDEADIILLLLSPDFLASDYAYSKEMVRALERHENGETRVIPVILRPVHWRDAPFSHLQVLPRDATPISLWHNSDEAFFDVVQGIRLACEESQKKHTLSTIATRQENSDPRKSLDIHPLDKVFIKSGFPYITFVEREDFGLLKLALAQTGRGIVIEGPSGVGKTTALKKAIEELTSKWKTSRRTSKVDGSLTKLSAREPKDRDRLKTLPNWHHGTVIIDDFHRLDNSLGREIVDYLKYLADTEPEAKKLVIVGIPQSGQTLVDLSFDVATRIDVFKWGKVKDELILQMVEKGEEALNIEFDRKTDIILAADGSLNVAQFLCLYICHKENISETQSQRRLVLCDVKSAISNVIVDLSRKFGESVRRFAAMGGHRDATCLRLLEELTLSDDGFISLPLLKDRNRELTHGIDRFINEGWMKKLYEEYPACMNHLFFDQATHALVIDDPQFTFYLNEISLSTIAKAVGKVVAVRRRKVFISYSHKDTEWLERLRVHLTPLEREGILDLWDDTKIKAGMQWKKELQAAIDSSTIAVMLISADFLASDFIAEHELPRLLSHAKAGGTAILPLVVSPCTFVGSGVDIFQTVNPPDKSLVKMPFAEREETLVKLAETIGKKLAGGEQ